MDDLPRVSRVKTPNGLKSVQVVLAVIAIGLGLAVLKPWGAAAPGPRPTVQFSPSLSHSAEPSVSAVGPNRLEGIAGQCYYANDWRVFARIESGGRPARTWVSIDPVAASEPTDRAIQVALVVAPAVPSFGYCAPVEGLEMPPAGLVAQAWKVVRGTATPIRLDPAGQVFPEDRPTHALWGPLAGADGRRPDSWPGGQYVIRLTGPDPAVYDRWFGVEIVLIAEPGARSPGTSPGGSRSPTPGGSSSPQP